MLSKFRNFSLAPLTKASGEVKERENNPRHLHEGGTVRGGELQE